MCVCVCYRVSSGQVSHRIPEGMITRLCLAPFSQELYPAMPSAEPFNGELCKVTEFDRTRQESCFNSNGHRSILEETEEDAYTKHYWSIKVTAFVCICHVLLDMAIFFSLTQTWGIRDIGGYIYIYIYIFIWYDFSLGRLGLGVPVRKIPEILKEAADELKRLQAAGDHQIPTCCRGFLKLNL